MSTGRLAPSPTGHLHLGHARSFLLAWWHARSRGGRIVLRLEDLDVERVKPGMLEETRRDLEWLGLDWDGEIVVQSAHTPAFDAAVRELVARGRAYPCICTRKEIAESQSAPHDPPASAASGADRAQATILSPANTRAPDAPVAPSANAPHALPPAAEKARYPGTCRGRFASLADARRASGRDPAVRLIVEPGTLELVDEFVGAFRADVWSEVGDFPIARRAGAPAYQLAVVVDDAASGVDEVVRGDDLLASAARQWLVQEALGLPHPRWWHVPLVTDATGRRLAKRSDDVSLALLRQRGVAAETLVAWIARRSGIDAGPRARARELVPRFDMKNVPRSPLRVGPEDLAELGL